jgi:methylated-DNA-[protein]-cysteine S-methyltransferase
VAGDLNALASRSDVAYRTTDSPFGRVLAIATGIGIVRLAFGDEDHDAALDDAGAALATTPVRGAESLDAFARELEEYFAGRRRSFATAPDLALVDGFTRRVLAATARIPYGAVATYGSVAALAGSPRAARAAGNALRGNPVPILVPCHRVVPAAGGIGGYSGQEPRKAALLALEETP